MGREIKRVPVDFDRTHPLKLGDTWPGYLMPQELRLPDCPDCDGTGATAGSKWMEALAHLMILLADDVELCQPRGQRLHPWLAANVHANTSRRPDASIVKLVNGLVGRESSGYGRCSSDVWEIMVKLGEAAGLGRKWGWCPTCEGSGSVPTPEQLAAHEAWEPTEPPTGPGWQLWQTVSEGGPVSPTFAKAGELGQWMVDNKAASDLGVAMRFIEAGWAPSGVTGGGGFMTGVEYVGRKQ